VILWNKVEYWKGQEEQVAYVMWIFHTDVSTSEHNALLFYLGFEQGCIMQYLC
jgi:hypothetical protein